jgi:ATP-dependent DNA helicase RecQ
MQTPEEILKQYWNLDSFRPQQREIIHSVLQGTDTLALLPTGGGKSICFQVPALLKNGLCLVVSPLVALMKEQVETLRSKNITAFFIHSGMAQKQVISTLKVAAASNCKFLYVSAERLQTSLFREFLGSLQINLVAIDEAHCISQWGYDFRPSYLKIADLREQLTKDVPVLALTASATAVVQKDICEKLKLSHAAVFRLPFARENLSLSIFPVGSKITKITEILQGVPGTAIVYCSTRRRTKQISDGLNAQGASSDYYHAGLTQEERNRKQDEWMKNRIRVMVCTSAFGLGINKPDVRSVIHADLPDCLETYYQQAGRAGRDQKRAYAVLLYSSADEQGLRQLTQLRFPPRNEIREVYQALVNYLHLPSGSGQGEYYDFDRDDFVRKFKLGPQKVLFALQTLEQENLLSYSDQIYAPSTGSFVATKARIGAFEKEKPDLEPLIQALLRTYPGIFDQPVNLYEKQLARIVRSSEPSVEEGLKILHHFGILDYAAKKDKPQLFFMGPRPRTEDVLTSGLAYEERKRSFQSRIQALLQYVKTRSVCRSRLLAEYFGDTDCSDCGICDNCLLQKRNTLEVNSARGAKITS